MKPITYMTIAVHICLSRALADLRSTETHITCGQCSLQDFCKSSGHKKGPSR